MSLLQKFQQFIKQENLFFSTDKLLLAVSGGLDSMVLAELCRQAGYTVIIAHCNFKLRGEESERDEAFVKSMAEKFGFPFITKPFDTTRYANDKKISIQVAARELRYQWFNEVLADPKYALNYLLTAHHADDNAETLAMNFFKGTGIAGLHGILPKQQRLIRPLLFASRQDLVAFANEHRLDWVEDSSNASDKYTRNFLRHQVFPLVQTVYPELVSNLGQNAQRFREAELLYRLAIDIHKKSLLEPRGSEIHIPVLKLKKVNPLATVVFEIMQEYGFSPAQTKDIIALLDSESGKYIQSSTHRVIRNRAWLVIAPNEPGIQSLTIIEQLGSWDTPLGSLHLQVEANQGEFGTRNESTALLDMDKLKFPLILRRWKQGDYFYPLGMPHKKKIARFLIDQKLSRTEKEQVWVLEMNRKICWVVGRRIDDRFKIGPNTRNVLNIQLTQLS